MPRVDAGRYLTSVAAPIGLRPEGFARAGCGIHLLG
jgi:hypothetical protein